MSSQRRLVVFAVLALGVLGCAGEKQHQRLEQEAARIVYVAPPSKVMAEARQMLESAGYTVRVDPNGNHVMSTPWKQLVDSPGMASQVRRYLVVGKDVGQGRFIARFYAITYTTVGVVDPHPSLGNHSYANGGGSAEGGGQRMAFVKMGQGAAPAKGWYERDLALEWKLLERLEPELAEEIKGGADLDHLSAAAHARR